MCFIEPIGKRGDNGRNATCYATKDRQKSSAKRDEKCSNGSFCGIYFEVEVLLNVGPTHHRVAAIMHGFGDILDVIIVGLHTLARDFKQCQELFIAPCNRFDSVFIFTYPLCNLLTQTI